MGGGDLLNLLVEKDIFPEEFTQVRLTPCFSDVALADRHENTFASVLHRRDGPLSRVLPQARLYPPRHQAGQLPARQERYALMWVMAREKRLILLHSFSSRSPAHL